MNKIWFPVVIFTVIITGGILYNSYVGGRTDEMIELSEKAYEISLTDPEASIEYLNKIDAKLEKISGLLCAFLDRDIINDAKDAIIGARGFAEAGSINCPGSIAEMKEKISHIKNSTEIKLKYIL